MSMMSKAVLRKLDDGEVNICVTRRYPHSTKSLVFIEDVVPDIWLVLQIRKASCSSVILQLACLARRVAGTPRVNNKVMVPRRRHASEAPTPIIWGIRD